MLNPAKKTAKLEKPAKVEKAAKAAKPPKAAKATKESKKKDKGRVAGLTEDLLKKQKEEAEEVVLTDAEGRRYCKVKDCDQAGMVEGYCRYHYLLLWKRIQLRRKILSEGKLEKYIEDLTSRYPDKYLEMIRKDLKSEKDFMAAIAELEIDEASDDSEFEDETQSFIEEVRGVSSETSTERTDDDY